MPIQFDPRERLAKPDLSAVPRIRFLTTVDFAPFNFIDQGGKLAGFHVDLAREICDELKVTDRCQIEAIPFADLTKALDRGEGEVIAAGIATSPTLRKSYLFSRPFLQLPARFVTRKGAVLTKAGPEGLDGKPVGVIEGTAHQAMLAAFFPASKIQPAKDHAALVADLTSGKVAAIFGDSRQLGFWVASPDAGNCCEILGGPYYSQDFLGEGMTLMLKARDRDLALAIDNALLELARSGRLNEIYLRYFPGGL